RASWPQEDLPELLLTLHDRDTIALFLARLAEQDQTQPLASFIVAACREFGWNAFAQELRQLITTRPDEQTRQRMRERHEIPLRDVEWLSAFCLDRTADPDRSALAHELCALAVGRFCAPPPRPAYYWPTVRRRPSVLRLSG